MKTVKKSVVAVEAASQDVTERIFDETKPRPEAAKTKLTPEFKPEETPAPEGAEEENLKKMIEESPRGDQGPTENDTPGEVAEQSRSVADARLPGVFPQPEAEDEPEEEERTFKTISRSMEELAIDTIEHFELLPDYVLPTTAERPIIVRTEEGNFCIEGWPLVVAAQSEGKTTILCEVDELETHSDEELCLRKVGIRSLTRGGDCVYAEMIRNARELLAMLLSSDDDLRIYGHGEKRYGEGFVSNREDDVRHILSLRLGKDRDSINQYLCHGEYLSNELLQFLIDQRAPKDFFVKAQVQKRIEITNQKDKKNFSTMRITTAISKFMLDAFEKFLIDKEEAKKKKATKPAPPETDKENQPEVAQAKTPAKESDGEVGEDGEAPGSDPEGTPEEPVTPEKILRTYDGVSKRMAEDLSKGISIPEMEIRLREELKMIMKILNMIESLSTSGK